MSPGALKLMLLRSQSPLWRTWARLLGAEVAPDVEVTGRLQVRIAPGAHIKLSPGVKISASTAINPLVSRTRSTFWAMAEGAVIELGPNVGCSAPCFCAAKAIRIGEGSIFGADCLIVDNDFHLPAPDWKWGDHSVETAKPVTIGRGCFLGARAIILKGVTIGDGAVVGAGAVVSRDVPAGHLATGNPATVQILPPRWCRDDVAASV